MSTLARYDRRPLRTVPPHVVTVLVLLGLTVSAAALDTSKGASGSNHAKAHTVPYQATGAGVNVVQIGTAMNGANTSLGGRFKGNLDFDGRTPQQNNGGDPPASAAAANDHEERTADIIGSSHGVFTGVATGANLFNADKGGVTAFAEFQAIFDYYHEKDLDAGTAGTQNANIFNQSAFVTDGGSNLNDNGANRFAKFVDWFIRTRDVVYVKAAGNNGVQITKPGGTFNGIVVGATDTDFRTRASYSRYLLDSDDGVLQDWRGKPDILAPGTNIGTQTHHPGMGAGDDSGTSFAAPHVTGIAALLAEKGLDGETAGRDHLAQKAIILNSARKRHINRLENTFAFALDHGTTNAQASDGDYLNGAVLRSGSNSAAAPKSGQWSPTDWSTDAAGKVLTTLRPLDDEQGTGVADAERALIQFDGGSHEENLAAGVPLIGWNRDAITGDASAHFYKLNDQIKKGTFITATLTWDRIIDEADNDNDVESTDTYNDHTADYGFLPDLDLFIYFKDDVVARSIGIGNSLRGQNVEHLHYPVFEDGDALDYSVRVDLVQAGTAAINYGLAWWTVPEPSALIILGGVLTGLIGRRPWRNQ